MKLNSTAFIFLTIASSNSIYADEKLQLDLDKKCEAAREHMLNPLRNNLI